jgi:uncharacterized repeat protein (TIGR03803 family)
LYSFPIYGDQPIYGPNPDYLIQASDGNLYGTTYSYSYYDYTNYGTVFRITADGAPTTLYSFTGGSDANPEGALVQGSDGNFYGTTLSGNTSSPYGSVFKISTNGVLTSLHSFPDGSDGAYPQAALVQGSDGYFYGTTPYFSYSGPLGFHSIAGSVFKISPRAFQQKL